MAYEDFIGLRYLMAKRRSRVVSVITLFAIAGVALGVTALIVVLSVMGGFKKDLKSKILGTKAHIVVQSKDGGPLDDPDAYARAGRSIDGITGAAPFVESETMASSPTNLSGMMLRGIEPETIDEVSELKSQLTKGKLEYLNNPDQAVDDLEASREESFERLIDEKDLKAGAKTGNNASDDENLDGAAIDPPESGESTDQPEPSSLSEALEEPPSESDDGRDEPAAEKQSDEETETESSNDESSSDSSDESGMPSIVPDEGNDDDTSDSEDEGGGMPSITGDEDAESTRLPGLFVGSELADSLRVDIGDEVNVVTPEGEMGPTGPLPRSRPFRVVGVFKTGMYEYDANFGYTHIRDGRDFFSLDGATGIEMKTEDPARAMALADKLRERLPDSVEVEDWKEMNQSLFFALQLEKIGMFLMLTLIVIVASFSIIAMLIMIVLEKKRDISVLKSLGVDRGGIMRIFMFQGVFIGSIGAMLGLGMGLGICWAMIEFGLPLNSEVYYIKTLPVDVQASEVITIVVSTIVISFLATLYPSLRAASLRPVEGLRYE